MLLKHGRDQAVRRGDQRCGGDSANCPKDEEGVFIGQE